MWYTKICSTPFGPFFPSQPKQSNSVQRRLLLRTNLISPCFLAPFTEFFDYLSELYWLRNLRFRMCKADCVLVMEQWTSFLSKNTGQVMGVCPSSLWALFSWRRNNQHKQHSGSLVFSWPWNSLCLSVWYLDAQGRVDGVKVGGEVQTGGGFIQMKQHKASCLYFGGKWVLLYLYYILHW